MGDLFLAGDGITVFTDGSCLGNPGPGGWGAVILYENQVLEFSGGEALTTNNRMELTGVIRVLEELKKTGFYAGQRICIHIDSQYVKNGITSWIKTWKKNGWKTASKTPVKNKELWCELEELTGEFNIDWVWVKGHAGNKYNEICDRLAQTESRKFQALLPGEG